jgi:hypothetical protein
MTQQELEIQGQQFYSTHQYAKAIPYIYELQKLRPNDLQLKIFEARSLYHLLRAPEAVAVMHGVVEKLDDPNYRILLSQYLQAVGEFDESYEILKKVPPEVAGYNMLMGWHKVRLGNFLEGWRHFQSEPGIIQLAKRMNMPQEKQLQKGTDIKGKTILFMLEGGFGDEILFSRFVERVEERGAKVIMGASRRIMELMQGSTHVKDARELSTIPFDAFDYYLPAVFSIDYLEIADPKRGFEFPYLFPEAAYVEKWRPILTQEAAGRKKIAIHWQGNWEFDVLEMKSPPASLMVKSDEVGKLFSLQRDAGGNALPPNSPVFDTEAGAPSWKSTAAVISEMDYVVTNDTSTAHLAGALGKKTLVLLLHAPHIYWVAKEHESVLYPNMYTFRQPKYNDWAGAVQSAIEFIKKDILSSKT